MSTEWVDFRVPSIGRLGELWAPPLLVVLVALRALGDASTVLSPFFSASFGADLPVVVETGLGRIVALLVLDKGVRAAVGLRTDVRDNAGLVAPPRNVELVVAVDVLLTGPGAFTRVVPATTEVLRRVVVPSSLAPSSVILLSVDASRLCARTGAVLVDVGLRALEAKIGRTGGLLSPDVVDLVAEAVVGLLRRSAREV